tara:strand:+ start:264 stop:440 length:177 start_codon:yes stop_codon:yes gene_type:complete
LIIEEIIDAKKINKITKMSDLPGKNIDDNKIKIEPRRTIKGGNSMTKASKFKLLSYSY